MRSNVNMQTVETMLASTSDWVAVAVARAYVINDRSPPPPHQSTVSLEMKKSSAESGGVYFRVGNSLS